MSGRARSTGGRALQRFSVAKTVSSCQNDFVRSEDQVLLASQRLGRIAGERDWEDGEAEMEDIANDLAASPVEGDPDRGARDAMTWLLAGGAVAARQGDTGNTSAARTVRDLTRISDRVLLSDCEWLVVTSDLLSKKHHDSEAAYDVLSRRVIYHVQHVARLPVPESLSNDEDFGYQIAVDVMIRLQANDFALLREWRRRQLRRKDHCSLEGLVKTVAWSRVFARVRSGSIDITRHVAPSR